MMDYDKIRSHLDKPYRDEEIQLVVENFNEFKRKVLKMHNEDLTPTQIAEKLKEEVGMSESFIGKYIPWIYADIRYWCRYNRSIT